MDEIKIFRVLNRINSIIFLLVLLSGLALIFLISFETSSWNNRGSVEVAENPADKNSAMINLILGNINKICGHDAQYIELRSKRNGGKFSSGYSGGETRNVLFLVGKELQTKWLFPDHKNLVQRVAPLKLGRDCKKQEEVLSIYYELVTQDTNKDGVLNSDDLSVLALTRPDGTNYVVIDSGVQSVIDKSVIDKGKTLMLLTQKEGMVQLKKYSIETFELISSKTILDIKGKSS